MKTLLKPSCVLVIFVVGLFGIAFPTASPVRAKSLSPHLLASDPSASKCPSLFPSRPLGPNTTTVGSGNWAGNFTTGNRGTYRSAQVEFVIPAVGGPDGADISFWAGVGGSTQTPDNYGLVQAGVDISLQPNFQRDIAWVEYVSNVSGQSFGPWCWTPQDINLYPGDTINIFVSSNQQSDGYDYFQVCTSHGSGNCVSFTMNGHFSDSASGECIGEGPNGGSPTALADFGTEQLNGCYIGTDTDTRGIGGWPHDTVYLTYRKSNTVVTAVSVAGPSSNGNSFSLTWCRIPGQGNSCG